jgi:16S rRNA (cytosine1402-N4)-methyltransferase
VCIEFLHIVPERFRSRRMTAAHPRDVSVRHVPVLGREAVEMLSPRDGGVYLDATFGAGGYSRAILDVPGTRVIGVDRDRTAIAGGFGLVEQSAGRLTLVEDRFSQLAEVCAAQGLAGVDGVVMDVGVSSMQLDEAGRGFSFRHDGPLDMRMGQEGPTAADVVARADETELANIIYIFGEERHSRGVARAIVAARKDAPISTTRALADIVASVVRAKPNEIHPATRTFQALRIFVNDELDELQLALAAAERVLKPGGRLAVVSFHSLEDRIVKNFLNERGKPSGGSRHLPELARAAPSFRLLTKRPVTAGDAEIAANPRARSAKLRAAERTDAPAHDAADLPSWPRLSDVMRGG